MTFAEIRHALETSAETPDDALREATGHAPELLPLVVELIEKLRAGVYLMPAEDRLLLRGLYVLAAAKTVALWPAWRALLELPEDELDYLFGDNVVTEVAAITLSLVETDGQSIFELLELQSTGISVRWALFDVLAYMAWDGRIERERARSFLERFERDDLAEDDDDSWIGWADAVVLLGLETLIPALDRVYAKPIFDFRDEAGQVDLKERLQAAAADFANPQRFADDQIAPIDDPVEALARFWRIRSEDDEAFIDEPPDSDDLPLLDPAEDVEPTPEYGNWLAGFLESRQVPIETMSLEEVDGFFTAIAAGPEMVPPSEFLPYIWGGGVEPAEGPAYDSEAQESFVSDLLKERWADITRHIDAGVPREPYMFWAVDDDMGEPWAAGFLAGMTLRSDAWIPLAKHRKGGEILGMIMALFEDDPDLFDEPVTPEFRREILDALPALVLAIAAYWRNPGGFNLREPARSKKVGRNEPCPCGSGRKYKKCCGANAG